MEGEECEGTDNKENLRRLTEKKVERREWKEGVTELWQNDDNDDKKVKGKERKLIKEKK